MLFLVPRRLPTDLMLGASRRHVAANFVVANNRLCNLSGWQRSFSSAQELEIPLQGNKLKFHHCHLYVDSLQPLSHYKEMEGRMNRFAELTEANSASAPEFDVQQARSVWENLVEDKSQLKNGEDYLPFKQDVVSQALTGAGWRIAATHDGPSTESVYIATSSDITDGAAFVVTAKKKGAAGSKDALNHFSEENLDLFFQQHAGKGGCAVLAFRTENVAEIAARYQQKHPALPREGFPKEYENGKCKIFEAYAYYAKDSDTVPDRGTVIRFVQGPADLFPLPGLERLPEADVCWPRDGEGVCDAFSDHWVSNVFDRERVLQTFNDVLGFEPKVNFNAGVVGAGEAVIESTVTGNDPGLEISDPLQLFKNQDQIFLPINNPLSPFGHVASYLNELGQGVQHMANRVPNLPQFVARANRYRKVTGEGLAFLNIPRSYYGFLQDKDFSKFFADTTLVEKTLFVPLREAGILDAHNIVKMDVTVDEVTPVLSGIADIAEKDRAKVAEVIRTGRYSNIKSLFKDKFNEQEYLSIVENKILVDSQGKDILLQIFTMPILLEEAGKQAPFFEFIQRICDEDKKVVKPGCGGFGIRNFLTLFLSIEVSNFMDTMQKAIEAGDHAKAEQSQKAIDIFTHQMHKSNPVLTAMSDAMEEQSILLQKMEEVADQSTAAYKEMLKGIEAIEKRKTAIQDEMIEIGEDHKAQMKALMQRA